MILISCFHQLISINVFAIYWEHYLSFLQLQIIDLLIPKIQLILKLIDLAQQLICFRSIRSVLIGDINGGLLISCWSVGEIRMLILFDLFELWR